MPRRRRKKKQPTKISNILSIFTWLLLAAVICASLAEFWWFFDLFSHFVVLYGSVGLILFGCLFVLKKHATACIALVLAVTQLYQLHPIWDKKPQMIGHYEEVKTLQYNVNRANTNIAKMLGWIVSKAEEIDVIVLLEITDKWNEALNVIKWSFPYHLRRPIRGDREIVVLSKLNVDEMEIIFPIEEDIPIVRMKANTFAENIPFVMYLLHPPPPVHSTAADIRNKLLTKTAAAVATEDTPHKIILGDLNITRFSPWFKKMQSISGLRDSNEGLGFIQTWPSFIPEPFGLALDNSLISHNIFAVDKKIDKALGSDHNPAITIFNFSVPKMEKNKETYGPVLPKTEINNNEE